MPKLRSPSQPQGTAPERKLPQPHFLAVASQQAEFVQDATMERRSDLRQPEHPLIVTPSSRDTQGRWQQPEARRPTNRPPTSSLLLQPDLLKLNQIGAALPHSSGT